MLTKRSQVLVIIIFTVLVFASIGITSITIINMRSSGEGQGSYRNVTMTDAYVTCEQRLKSELGSNLSNYSPDNLSTRYSQKRGRFLIFFRAQLKESGAGLSDNYVTCEVSGSGSIQQFHIALETEDGQRVNRKSKNPFEYTF